MSRLHFWTQLYTKAISPINIPYCILKHISSRLKPFSTGIFFFREEPGGYGDEGELKDFNRPYHGFRRHFDE